MTRVGRTLAGALASAALLAGGCGGEDAAVPVASLESVEIDDHEGAVCGMLVRGQSAPRAQVIHRDGERAFVCSIGDLLVHLGVPSPHGSPSRVWVEVLEPEEDPSQSDTGPHPWIPAEDAFYVVGIERPGIMGPPVLVYRTRADAQRVAEGTDARILDFDGLKAWWEEHSRGHRHPDAATGGPPKPFVLADHAMGTTWSVTLAPGERTAADVDRARAAVEVELAAVDRLMSTWREDSELSRFNRHVSAEPFPLSPRTLEVLRLAEEVSQASSGAFDVTVGPLVAAWGFGAHARSRERPPDADELETLRARVGFRNVHVDPRGGSARKQRPDVECDLSAIAKGYAIDEIARALAALGWHDFLVELGGEVRASGLRPGGEPWRVGVERPDASGRATRVVVALHDQALATSGDYRSFHVRGGQRRAHIIDPRSGRPVEHALASVSVVHRQAALADAWATALIVLGPDDGFARAEAEGLGAYFIVRTGADTFAFRATSGFPPIRG